MRITADYYSFLLEIGCPYEGYVQGLGDIYCMPILMGSATPQNNSKTGNATYLSTNYASVIIPNREEELKLAAQQIDDNFIKLTADGYLVQDINTNTWQNFGNNISKKKEIVGDKITITVTGDKGQSYTYISDTAGGTIRGGHNLENSINISDSSAGRKIYGAFDSGFDLMEHKLITPYKKGRFEPFNGMKRSRQVKHTYDAMKWMKSKGLNIKTKPSVFVDKTLPRVLRITGRVTLVLSAFFILYDVGSNKAVKTSNILDTGMLVVSVIPYGWIAGATYFIIDGGFEIFTGRSLGDRLDDWAEDEFGLKDGVIWDLSPFLNPIYESIGESFDKITDFFSTTYSF